MIHRIKEYRLRNKLEEMYQVASRRRDSNKSNQWLSFYEYLNSAEQLEYSRMATEHFYLCQKIGKGYSSYFVKQRDPVKNDPDSPHALMTVDDDVSHEVVYKNEDGRVYGFLDGEGVEIGISAEEFFGTRLTHPERWEDGWEPKVD